MRKYICVNIYKQKKHGIESCKCSKRHGVTAQEVDNSILLRANIGIYLKCPGKLMIKGHKIAFLPRKVLRFQKKGITLQR